MNPEKKTLIPYICEFSIKDHFQNYPRKDINSNFSYLRTRLTRVILPTGELLYDCVHRELIRKFSFGSMKEIYTSQNF